MARIRTAARLHQLTVKQIQAAGEGDHGDGGGLLRRIRGASCSWVLRFTPPKWPAARDESRRRQVGSADQAGDSITAARRQAHEARELLQDGG
jgi:hypothetical protein